MKLQLQLMHKLQRVIWVTYVLLQLLVVIPNMNSISSGALILFWGTGVLILMSKRKTGLFASKSNRQGFPLIYERLTRLDKGAKKTSGRTESQLVHNRAFSKFPRKLSQWIKSRYPVNVYWFFKGEQGRQQEISSNPGNNQTYEASICTTTARKPT
jgi:hypothetical protein